MNDLNALSYIFIPVAYCDNKDMPLRQRFNEDDRFSVLENDSGYLLNFVKTKYEGESSACIHYILNNDFINEKCNVIISEGLEDYNTSSFGIFDVHLYCFKKRLLIIAIEVRFDSTDLMEVSNTLFELKRLEKNNIVFQSGAAFSMLEKVKEMLKIYNEEYSFDYFFYANQGSVRANILTYAETQKENTLKELYYLRNCFYEGYSYNPYPSRDEYEICSTTNEILWGITKESAVCLAHTNKSNESFVNDILRRNFKSNYLFMYILLLYQKYMLYLFMSDMSDGKHNDLEKLENYRSELYEFEADYVYSVVTEVPQYQVLYDRITQVFCLKAMFEDVHEPLEALGEIRRIASEEKNKTYENRMNLSVALLSLLAVFSALIDSYDFIGHFSDFYLMPIGVIIIQAIFAVLIVLIAVFAIRNFISVIGEKNKSSKGKQMHIK